MKTQYGHHPPFRSGRKNPPLLISLSLSFFNLGFNSQPITTMSSATTSLFKPLAMADGCITSFPTISTLKTSYPFSSLPSKPIKPLHLSYASSPSPSWVSLKNKFSSSNLITLVASTSDWAQQEEENPTEETVTEPETETQIEAEASISDYEGEVATEEVEESAADGTLDTDYEQDPPEEAKLFVGNLPYDVTSEQLAQLFDQAGEVQVSEVIYNRETDRSRGFGFVWFKTVDEAEKAIEMFNRYDLNGRYLTVNTAAPRGSRPERTPRAFEPSFRIYVGNLPWQVDDARLEQVFSEYGKVVEARVVYDRESGRSRGFAFVTMSSQNELDDAINAMDGQNLDGRTLTVNVAQERPRRSSF